MKIVDFLSPGAVQIIDGQMNKKQVLTKLAEMAAAEKGMDTRTVLDALIERERLGTTGVGRGVALPHTRLSGLDKIFGAFVRAEPVDFEAVDDKPVDIFFLLLVPEKDGADHLKALARLSRLVRDESAAAALRNAESAQDVYRVIQEKDVDE